MYLLYMICEMVFYMHFLEQIKKKFVGLGFALKTDWRPGNYET